MTVMEAYIKGLETGVEFCVKCIRDLPISEAVVRDVFNVAANSLEKNFKEIIKEYNLDHSASGK